MPVVGTVEHNRYEGGEVVKFRGRLVVRSRGKLPAELREAFTRYKPLLVAAYTGAGDMRETANVPSDQAGNEPDSEAGNGWAGGEAGNGWAGGEAGNGWAGETGTLVAWFLANEGALPAEPFQLNSYSRVVEPATFYVGVRRAIADGPDGYAARCGSLARHLRQLRAAVERA